MVILAALFMVGCSNKYIPPSDINDIATIKFKTMDMHVDPFVCINGMKSYVKGTLYPESVRTPLFEVFGEYRLIKTNLTPNQEVIIGYDEGYTECYGSCYVKTCQVNVKFTSHKSKDYLAVFDVKDEKFCTVSISEIVQKEPLKVSSVSMSRANKCR